MSVFIPSVVKNQVFLNRLGKNRLVGHVEIPGKLWTNKNRTPEVLKKLFLSVLLIEKYYFAS